MLLLDTANRRGWPDGMTLGTDDAAWLTGVTVPTFLQARTELEQRGLITCGHGGGRGRKASYRITDAPTKSIKNPKAILGKDGINYKKNDKVSSVNPKINTPLNFRVYEPNPKMVLPFSPIDIDSSYKTNNLIIEKEYYVKKKHDFPVYPMPKEHSIEDVARLLNQEQIWADSICMKFGIDPACLPGLIDEYRLHCITIGEASKNLKDAKRHFTNWLRKRQNNQPGQQDNETKRQDRLSERRGTDPSALRPEDYADTL